LGKAGGAQSSGKLQTAVWGLPDFDWQLRQAKREEAIYEQANIPG
jgi:hypothetical protein